MKQTGNTMLITGGGSGIGRALAETFHRLGNHVIISGRRQAKLDEVTAANPGMQSLTVDIEDGASLTRFAESIAKQYPALNVVINNAGVMENENLQDPTTEVAERTIAINLLGPIRLTSLLLETLMRNADPVIMTVSSGLAYLPLAMTPTYCATKAAIHSYTQSLRFQLRETPVQVLELVPPYVQTSLMGERQQTDANAMPLADFIAEVMQLLAQEPTPPEICVKRVAMQRESEYQGREKYDDLYRTLNENMLKARGAEFPPAKPQVPAGR